MSTNQYAITGTIESIGPVEEFTNFSKRIVIVREDSDRYPQDFPLTFGGNSVDKPSGFKEGDKVTARFSISSREYNGRYYVDLRAWKIEAAVGYAIPQKAPTANAADNRVAAAAGGQDDIPF